MRETLAVGVQEGSHRTLHSTVHMTIFKPVNPSASTLCGPAEALKANSRWAGITFAEIFPPVIFAVV